MSILRRAHLYHHSRMYLNAMYRERTPLDDKLIQDLTELSLSQYTRLRRYCQSVVRSVSEVCSSLVLVHSSSPHPNSVTFVPRDRYFPLYVIH